MFKAIFEYEFLQNAVLAAFITAIVGGIVGVIIVEKKLVMMTGGIAHTSYGGVGLGFLLGFEPIIGAFMFSIMAALGIGVIKNRSTGAKDIIIAMFWSLGMALGILFISLTPGYPPIVSSYLFGNILSVTRFDLVLMMVLAIIILAVIFVFYQEWKAHLFDQQFTRIMRKKTILLENVLLILLALTVVVLIRVVGIILVIALLSVPASASSYLTGKLHLRMVYSMIFSFIFIFSGLIVSYYTDISTGAVIVFAAVILYILTWLYSRRHKHKLEIKED
ncbi:metal ABC transporter permease [Hujiaoplasma nucleasis]|uniref:Metal ABC transporter permease n=1 Tax=Hujiaoplasma nucleasis TaxID=2725268 RepID=A0A7L6N5W4_9MOLU|nr:metal ABC transporter permease [Hujiaoplasma nucleasis]QLY39884.1 metal ABC transporter permease [Hujiaoplasma nucleasis]